MYMLMDLISPPAPTPLFVCASMLPADKTSSVVLGASRATKYRKVVGEGLQHSNEIRR